MEMNFAMSDENRKAFIKELEKLGTQKVLEKVFANKYNIYTGPIAKAWLKEKENRSNRTIGKAGIVIGLIGLIFALLQLIRANKVEYLKSQLDTKIENIHQRTQIAQQNNYYISSPKKLKEYIDTISSSTKPSADSEPRVQIIYNQGQINN